MPLANHMGLYVCSCGRTDHHEVARRLTSDGVDVVFWSNGDVTDRSFTFPPGVGSPRSRFAEGIACRANEALREDVCMLTWAEVAIAVKEMRKLLTKGRYGNNRDALRYLYQTKLKPAVEAGHERSAEVHS